MKNISPLERELLLAWVLGKDRAWVKMNTKTPLSWIQKIRFRYACWQRGRGVPMAYILGYQDWMGMRLQVNKHTLIPRDETEILCEHIKTHNRNFEIESVLDIGTGSGAIALWCKSQKPHSKVVALDISKKAISVAQTNAKNLGLDIDLQYSDLLSVIEEGSHIDVIIANLPYVPKDMVVERDLDFEPQTALFSGPDGLDHIRRLADQIQEKHIPFKELWLEFLPEQAEIIEQIFCSMGKVEFKKDLSGQIFFAVVTK